MKLRFGTPSIDDQEEQRAEEELRRLTAGDASPAGPADAYWANLLVRTNQRIDDATSPKALTISWAARVAIPGVLLILSFLVGMWYFVPLEPRTTTPLKAVVLSLPDSAVDTMLVDPSRISPGFSVAELEVDPFAVQNEDLAEYLIAAGNVRTVTETLSEDQVTDVLTILGSQNIERISGGR
jgi:hypothetical protein